jgi:mRNA interferase MazF
VPSESRSLKRGMVVRVRLNPVEGSEQGGERPTLVLSPDIINERSPVILVAAITSKKTENVRPFEALLTPPEGGLTLPSKVMLMHLRSVDRQRITGILGTISDEAMEQVEIALKIAVGITPT